MQWVRRGTGEKILVHDEYCLGWTSTDLCDGECERCPVRVEFDCRECRRFDRDTGECGLESWRRDECPAYPDGLNEVRRDLGLEENIEEEGE